MQQSTLPNRKAVLLVNLGTPDRPTFGAVYRYLTEFLNDPLVVDVPLVFRLILVNLLIIPKRAKAVARLYRQLWGEGGSPLMAYSLQQKELLQKRLGNETKVFLAMRYQSPSIASVLAQIEKEGFSDIHIIPLFPQYARATNLSVIRECERVIKRWKVAPRVIWTKHFATHPAFIDALIAQSKSFAVADYDHILFSFHGLPVRQIEKAHEKLSYCGDGLCPVECCKTEQLCYKAHCSQTTRLLTKELGLEADQFSICFQSRLDSKWIRPYTDKVVKELAQSGKRKILVFSPAFVADCLETTLEIGEELAGEFKNAGGEQLDLVPGLNDSPRWIDCLEALVNENTELTVKPR
jgi:protoporphyrin/coproporphyrin ferrochelatase